MTIPYESTRPEMTDLLKELSSRVVSCTTQELGPNMHQISNVPFLLPQNDDDPMPGFNLLMKFPPIKVISASTYDLKDYISMGSEEEVDSLLDSVFQAYECGDINLTLQPDEVDSWSWFQHVPSILRAENPDWRIIATTVDDSGLCFDIIAAKPLPDGRPELQSFGINEAVCPVYSTLFTTADGCKHGYFQGWLRDGHGASKYALLTVKPDGAQDFCVLEESEHDSRYNCIRIFHCR